MTYADLLLFSLFCRMAHFWCLICAKLMGQLFPWMAGHTILFILYTHFYIVQLLLPVLDLSFLLRQLACLGGTLMVLKRGRLLLFYVCKLWVLMSAKLSNFTSSLFYASIYVPHPPPQKKKFKLYFLHFRNVCLFCLIRTFLGKCFIRTHSGRNFEPLNNCRSVVVEL